MRVPCKRRSRRGPDACHSLMTSPVMLVITRAALWLGRRGSRTHHPDSSRYCNGASSGTRAIATPQCPARAYGLRYETWAAARVSRRQRSLPVLDRATDGGASGLYELPGFTLTGACLATCAGLLCGLVVRACPRCPHPRVRRNRLRRTRSDQKSVHRPFTSQSPYRVGSGPFGPPISFGFCGADGASDAVGCGGDSVGVSIPVR